MHVLMAPNRKPRKALSQRGRNTFIPYMDTGRGFQYIRMAAFTSEREELILSISLFRCSQEDAGGIIRMEEGGMLVSEHDVRYSPNAITVVTNAAAMPGQVSMYWLSCSISSTHSV